MNKFNEFKARHKLTTEQAGKVLGYCKTQSYDLAKGAQEPTATALRLMECIDALPHDERAIKIERWLC